MAIRKIEEKVGESSPKAFKNFFAFFTIFPKFFRQVKFMEIKYATHLPYAFTSLCHFLH